MRLAVAILGVPCLLLASGCRAETTSPTTLAAATNDVTTLRALLAGGASPDGTDADPWPPLAWAARRGQAGAIDVLLEAGADPDIRDRRHGWTPLMHAIHKRQRAAALQLLEGGAGVNAPEPYGTTPLMMAAIDDDVELVEALLARGARPQARTTAGVTALDIAVSGGAFADLDRPLLGGCHPGTVRALLAADPALRPRDGFGPLSARWWARMKGCEEVVRLVKF